MLSALLLTGALSGQVVQTPIPEERVQILNRDSRISTEGSPLAELLGDELYLGEKDLSSSLFDALGDSSIELSLFRLGSSETSLEFRPQRKVYYFNPDDVSKPTRYLVVNNLISRLKIDQGASELETGISFRVFRLTDTPWSVPNPEQDVDNEIQKALANSNSHGFLGTLSKIGKFIFDNLENLAQKVSGPFVGSEQNAVLLDKLFDPLREPFSIPLNANYVEQKLQVGEVASLTYFGGLAPGLGVGTGVFESSADIFYRLSQQTTVLKEGPNSAILRQQWSIKRGVEANPANIFLGVSLGPIHAGISILRWQMEKANQHIVERIYRFDLSQSEQRKAFDLAVKKDFSLADKVAQNLAENTTKREIARRRFRAALGFASFRNQSQRSVDRVTTPTKKNFYYGFSSAETYSHIHLFKYRDEEFKSKVMQVTPTALYQKLVFSDKFTSASEYGKYLNLIQLSLGQKLPAIILNRAIPEKSRQEISLEMTYSSEIMLKALSYPLEKMWPLLGEILIDQPQLWRDASSRSQYFEEARTKNLQCPASPALSNLTSVPCVQNFLVATQVVSTFEGLKRTKDIRKQLILLSKLHSSLGNSPLMNFLILRMAREMGVQQGVQYQARFAGDGLVFPVYLENGEVTPISKLPNSDLLDRIDNLQDGNNRILKARFYSDKLNPVDLFLEVETRVPLSPRDSIGLWVKKDRILVKDKVEHTIFTQGFEAHPHQSDARGPAVYTYILKLPTDVVFEKNKRYMLDLRIQNSAGRALSEIGKIEL